MWLFRPAHPAEATEACTVIRRSILELCIADHGDDAAILEAWLANKTPERLRSWIEINPASLLVGVGAGGIAGVGCVLPNGAVALNYVAPRRCARASARVCSARWRVSRPRRVTPSAPCMRTATAQGFYVACGYEAAGEPVSSFGGKPAYPMRRAIIGPSGKEGRCRSSG